MQPKDLTGHLAVYRLWTASSDIDALHAFLTQGDRWNMAVGNIDGPIPQRQNLLRYLSEPKARLRVWAIHPQGKNKPVGNLLWSMVCGVGYAHLWFYNDAWDADIVRDALEQVTRQHFANPLSIDPVQGQRGIHLGFYGPLPADIEAAVVESGFDPGGGPLPPQPPNHVYFHFYPTTFEPYYGSSA